MALGFWNLATEDPERIALVTRTGGELTAGELHDAANRVSHGLRALGLETGDTVAVVLPNGLPMLEVYLGALQIGLYLTPINHHLVGPEIAYIVNDSDAKVFIADERFADEVAKAARPRSASPTTDRFAVGDDRRLPALRRADRRPARPRRPTDRIAGAAMHYTSGTTGRPKGVQARRCVDIDPDDMGALSPGSWACSASQPRRRQRAHHRLAALPHGRAACGRPTRCTSATQVVLMDKWTPEAMLRADRRAQGDHAATWCRPSSTACSPCPRRSRAKYDVSSLRCMVHAAAPVPARDQAADDRVVGRRDHASTTPPPRAAARSSPPSEWLEKPGHRRRGRGRARDPHPRRRRQRAAGRHRVGTVYMTPGAGQLRVQGRRGEDRGQPPATGFFTVGDVGPARRGRLPVPQATARPT